MKYNTEIQINGHKCINYDRHITDKFGWIKKLKVTTTNKN